MQISFDSVTADYQIGPIRSPRVLDSIDLLLPAGSFTAVIGHTGSGKSSLLKAMNGLIIPYDGKVTIGQTTIKAGKNKKALRAIRQKVGMVFQFPESQLFAETVEKDICFGPLNFGVSLVEAKSIARVVLKQVGLEPSILSKSPLSLSGGQKRRVAIAGILAMQPDILVLDEPGAGLDPIGKREILQMITAWHKEKKLTTVIVTHDMDDVALYADDVVVMEHGQVVKHDKVRSFFTDVNQLNEWHVDVPQARSLQLQIEQETGIKLPGVCLTLPELADALIEVGIV
ncbi:energy-coupling factor transporter ATPase [Aquibacillus rhizosphaerae]|uniref:Energy-coupling factor transporter ATP-binding protein EcfA2 n=1 Tax=Aquibacillus rhizosphaerae TaxID=3051431 RepID=A0ABT7L3Q5_9BACI|nr:energy-coupling factor transporter ATPase [Aquibacillus sp. LR5S19]MDL4840493.1 energy-coupling factor transporter ATPase [Aquibacillus sp. LR5S19]